MREWIYFIHPPRHDLAATMTDEERAVWGVHFEAPDEAAARAVMEGDPVIAGGFALGEPGPRRRHPP